MKPAERAAKLVQLVQPSEKALQEQLDQVRREKYELLKRDKNADVRDLVTMERVLRDVLVNLTSGRAQIEEIK